MKVISIILLSFLILGCSQSNSANVVNKEKATDSALNDAVRINTIAQVVNAEKPAKITVKEIKNVSVNAIPLYGEPIVSDQYSYVPSFNGNNGMNFSLESADEISKLKMALESLSDTVAHDIRVDSVLRVSDSHCGGYIFKSPQMNIRGRISFGMVDKSCPILYYDPSYIWYPKNDVVFKMTKEFRELIDLIDRHLNDTDALYEIVDEMPKFPGGIEACMTYIKEKVAEAKWNRESCAQGRVIIGFVVEKDGSISNVEVLRSVEEDRDKVAKQIVEGMPKWIPGKMYGQPVRVKSCVPVQFRY